MIFIFNGPPGSGKDAACILFKELGYTHLSFKEQLFTETIKYFNVTREWFMKDYENRAVKESPCPELNGYSRRSAMIFVSEEYIKPKFGQDYFGDMLARQLNLDDDFCVSDGGFKEEITPIINKLGADKIILVQLTREGCNFSSDSRRYINGTFEEEYILGKKTPITSDYILEEKFPIKTYRVHNNATVNEFHSVLNQIHEKEQNARKIFAEKGQGS